MKTADDMLWEERVPRLTRQAALWCAWKGVSLTDEEFEEEIRLLVRAFGVALFTTIHEAQKPTGEAKAGRKKAMAHWSAFARQLIQGCKGE